MLANRNYRFLQARQNARKTVKVEIEQSSLRTVSHPGNRRRKDNVCRTVECRFRGILQDADNEADGDYLHRDVIRDAKQAGADKYITKPFDRDELLESIADLLGQKV